MSGNVGGVERPIRIILGAGLLILALFGSFPTGWTIALSVIGGVALLTGAVGYCPAWALFGVNTCDVRTTRKAA